MPTRTRSRRLSVREPQRVGECVPVVVDAITREAVSRRLNDLLDAAEDGLTTQESGQFWAGLLGALTWHLAATGHADEFAGMLARSRSLVERR